MSFSFGNKGCASISTYQHLYGSMEVEVYSYFYLDEVYMYFRCMYFFLLASR